MPHRRSSSRCSPPCRCITSSNVVLNFLAMALLIALVGQGWNVLGGYGGQYSFGHAAFFGTGAYVTAILQVRYGINAGSGLRRHRGGRAGRRRHRRAEFPLRPQGLLFCAGHSGLRRSAAHHRQRRADHRRRRRHADQARPAPEAFQFQSRAPFYWIILAFVAVLLAGPHALIEDSRFGAYLVAVRENEDAAQGARRRTRPRSSSAR